MGTLILGLGRQKKVKERIPKFIGRDNPVGSESVRDEFFNVIYSRSLNPFYTRDSTLVPRILGRC